MHEKPPESNRFEGKNWENILDVIGTGEYYEEPEKFSAAEKETFQQIVTSHNFKEAVCTNETLQSEIKHGIHALLASASVDQIERMIVELEVPESILMDPDIQYDAQGSADEMESPLKINPVGGLGRVSGNPEEAARLRKIFKITPQS